MKQMKQMKQMKLKKLFITALLMLAGIQTGGTGGDGGDGGGTGVQTGAAKPEPTVAELIAQITLLTKEVKDQKSQVGHFKTELEKAKNNGLSQEEIIANQEKDLAERNEILLQKTLMLHVNEVAKDVPEVFRQFININKDRTAASTEDDLKKSIVDQTTALVAALKVYTETQKKGKAPIVLTAGAATADEELSAHTRAVVDNLKAAASETTVFDPWAPKK